MPDRTRRSPRFGGGRTVAVMCLLWLALLGAAAAAGPAAAGPAPAAPASAAAPDGDTVGGLSVDDVVSALSDNHVAVIGGRSDEARLAEVVSQARDSGLHLSVVSVGVKLTNQDAQLLADEVLAQIGGSVLVLTPVSGGAASSELSDSQLTDAKAAGRAAGSDDVAATLAFAESATAKRFPWSLAIIGGIILLVVIAIGGGIWERRRKQKSGEEALTDLTAGLAERVGSLAAQIQDIGRRVEVAERPDLEQKFNRAGADYNRLRDRLASPLADRRQVDATTAEIASLEKRLAEIDRQLDAALPGR